MVIPLFPIFIGGIVAYQPEDRAEIRIWFESICAGTRGNVVPAWHAMRYVWDWMDAYEANTPMPPLEIWECESHEIKKDLVEDNSDAWWEELVTSLSFHCGRLTLT